MHGGSTMFRLLSGLALAVFLAACNATDGTQVAATSEDDAALTALAPAAGGTAEPAAAPEGEGEGTEVAALTTPPVEETPQVDELANTYLNCVVGRASQESQAGTAEERAVELGVDACRNQFREARWAYLDTGVSEDEADRYGVNLLTYVRDQAHEFLQSGT